LKREDTNLDLKLEAMRILNLSKRGGGGLFYKKKRAYLKKGRSHSMRVFEDGTQREKKKQSMEPVKA
jgi:hypothetical protein